jgi:hypothetical protein
MGESRYPLTRIILALAIAGLLISACTEQPQPSGWDIADRRTASRRFTFSRSAFPRPSVAR